MRIFLEEFPNIKKKLQRHHLANWCLSLVLLSTVCEVIGVVDPVMKTLQREHIPYVQISQTWTLGCDPFLTTCLSWHPGPTDVGQQMVDVGCRLFVLFVFRGLQTDVSHEINEFLTINSLWNGNPTENIHTFGSLSSSPSLKNQSDCQQKMLIKIWFLRKDQWCVSIKSYMQNQRLHYFVSVRHVSDHVGHVVLWRPHQGRTKHQGQVSGLHLRIKPQWSHVLSDWR